MTMLVSFDQDLIPLSLPIRLCVLGSTGSIGLSALEIVRRHPEKFEVVALGAGSNAALLGKQIAEFKPRYAALFDEKAAVSLRSDPAAAACSEILSGSGGISSLAALPEADIVLAAIVGATGLGPVLTALEAGKRIALANKESLVAGGSLVSAVLRRRSGSIIPVDSEHSAIFQALLGQHRGDLSSLILTASGGAFLKIPLEQLGKVTPREALQHPNWSMGAKVTIDSSTMMNKALEVIEAYWLFGVEADRIEVLIHPQSIVHSLVSFVDGTRIAQLSVPDMKGPIAFALTHPGPRLPEIMAPLDLPHSAVLEFLELDAERFPAVDLAKDCLRAGGGAAAVLNAANEVAVERFLRGALPFNGIVALVREAVDRFGDLEFSDYQGLLDLMQEVKTKLNAD